MAITASDSDWQRAAWQWPIAKDDGSGPSRRRLMIARRLSGLRQRLTRMAVAEVGLGCRSGRPAGPEPPNSESERLLNLNLEAQSRSAAEPGPGLTLMVTARG